MSYDDFEEWWKTRTGDSEPNIPVLPEYMVWQLEQLNIAGGDGNTPRANGEGERHCHSVHFCCHSTKD